MKTPLAIVIALVLALAGLVVLDGYRDLSSEVRALTDANQQLQARLADIEQRLVTLNATPSTIAAATSTQPASTLTATGQTFTPEALRIMVADIIAAERAENQVRVNTAVNANLQRWRSKNRQTDSSDVSTRGQRLRDTLDLDVGQLAEYEALTDSFAQEAEKLYAEVDATDLATFTQQMARVDQEMALLSDEFDTAFSAVLTAQQLEDYARLPADSRGLAPELGAQALEFDLSDMLRLAESD